MGVKSTFGVQGPLEPMFKTSRVLYESYLLSDLTECLESMEINTKVIFPLSCVSHSRPSPS